MATGGKLVTLDGLKAAFDECVNIDDYNPEAKTSAMTKVVGKDSSGKLWTEPVEQAEIISATESWLDAHVNPQTGYVVDNSLSISGAAADAAACGELKSALTGLSNDVILINRKTLVGTQIQETAIEFNNVGELYYGTGLILTSETSYRTSDFIDISDLSGIYRTGTTTMFTLWTYSFYDSNKNFLESKGNNTNYAIETYGNKQVTWLDLSVASAKYVRITIDPSRPYTYYTVKNINIYSYDIPSISINNVELLKFYRKKIVNFGDSIFGNFRDTNDTTDKSISKMIADATGATVYNAGFGGCRMAIHSTYWNAFSMYSLAYAIANNDWTEQDTAILAAPSGMPSYFSDTVTLLKSIDFDEIDYITIGYGTNDYTGDIFVNGNEFTFEHECDYFKGALRYSLRTILNAFPHIRIVVISPCWRWFLNNGVYSYSSDDPQSVNSRGYYLYDYVNACKTVCEEYHVPYIDTYYTLGFNEYTHLEYFPANDGTHMNEAGRQLIADRIVGQMESIY